MRTIAFSICVAFIVCACSGKLSLPIPFVVCGTNNVQAQTVNPIILQSPKIKLVFWGEYWITTGAAQLNSMTLEWETLANDPNFYAPLAEYGVGNGSLAGTYTANLNIASGKLAEKYITQELQNEINNGELPAADDNSIYMIMLPPETQSGSDNFPKYGGHHSVIGNVVYAIAEYSSNPIINGTVISHEIYEAVTDPYLNAYNGGSGEAEVGDLCNGTDHDYSLDGYSIQRVWGQDECACIPVVADAGGLD
jgi:hypothetical protein